MCAPEREQRARGISSMPVGSSVFRRRDCGYVDADQRRQVGLEYLGYELFGPASRDYCTDAQRIAIALAPARSLTATLTFAPTRVRTRSASLPFSTTPAAVR